MREVQMKFLSPRDMARLRNSAQKAQKVETVWDRKAKKLFDTFDNFVLEAFEHGKPVYQDDFDFQEFFIRHAYESMRVGIVTASSEHELETRPVTKSELPFQRLAKEQRPRSMKGLFELYEKWRKGKGIPPRLKREAARIQKQYFKKVQSVFDKYEADFREGKTFKKEKAREFLKRETKMPRARAEMTVRTETTHYYNSARRNYYDGSPDVTHYLFVSIRDMATTKWCKTRQGVVYAKGSAYLEKETPPIHWNCRSEILPLTPLNPQHEKLIKDRSRQRANRRPEPLPRGWQVR